MVNFSFSSLLKQLKKLLKQQKKRWVSLALIFLAAGVSVSASAYYLHKGMTATAEEERDMAVWTSVAGIEKAGSPETEAVNRSVMEVLKQDSREREVFYQKNFVCGEEVLQIGWLTPEEIRELHEKNPSAAMSINEQEQLTFIEAVEDLSDQCKENAYFGIDKDGNLSLFEGLPSDEQIIRTFFQLNVQHLKSSLPRETLDQLYQGIRILDMEDYNSVISTFSDYAVPGGKIQ